MPSPKLTEKLASIRKSRVLLVEGIDAYYFWIRACEAFTENEIEVFDFGGNQNLRRFLDAFRERRNFEAVTSLVIIRDTENNAEAAINSIQSALKNANLPVPATAFEFAEGSPRTAFLLHPGFEIYVAGERVFYNGTLEDLCLMTVEGDPCLKCVAQYMECVVALGENMRHIHKMRLHAYLAGKDKYVGLKVGESARVGAWNWDHTAFASYRDMIAAM